MVNKDIQNEFSDPKNLLISHFPTKTSATFVNTVKCPLGSL